MRYCLRMQGSLVWPTSDKPFEMSHISRMSGWALTSPPQASTQHACNEQASWVGQVSGEAVRPSNTLTTCTKPSKHLPRSPRTAVISRLRSWATRAMSGKATSRSWRQVLKERDRAQDAWAFLGKACDRADVVGYIAPSRCLLRQAMAENLEVNSAASTGKDERRWAVVHRSRCSYRYVATTTLRIPSPHSPSSPQACSYSAPSYLALSVHFPRPAHSSSTHRPAFPPVTLPKYSPN